MWPEFVYGLKDAGSVQEVHPAPILVLHDVDQDPEYVFLEGMIDDLSVIGEVLLYTQDHEEPPHQEVHTLRVT